MSYASMQAGAFSRSVPETPDETLGQDFLTWLWYRGETSGGFKSASGEKFSVIMEKRVVVRGGEGELAETASVSGAASELREARLGLTTGKKVIRALIRLDRAQTERNSTMDQGAGHEEAEESWQFALKAEDFSLGGFKTPKISGGLEKDEDPEAVFFEKVYLLEKGLEFLDALFRFFLNLRLGKEWQEELASIRRWMYPEAA